MKEDDTRSRLRFSENSREVSSENSKASVRILGNLGRLPDGKRLESETVEAPEKLGRILEIIMSKHGVDLRRDSTLVLVNGVEANALNDLETMIQPRDQVILIPMFHGGSGV